MEENCPSELEKARAELASAHRKLFGTYLERIRDIYNGLEFDEREYALRGLNSLVQKLESEGFLAFKPYLELRSRRKNLAFDASKAREIRVKSGLSIDKLIERLGLARSGAYMLISKYEKGRLRPSNPPRGETSKKYVAWLKENGYNPFNLWEH